jgi:purine-binding chemotaxis protein CheW
MIDTTDLIIETVQIITLNIANEEYALSISNIQEIIKNILITPVPLTKKFVEGVTNIRGSIIPVVNLRVKMGIEKQEHTEDSRIIIISYNGRKVGVLVDSINQVLRLPKEKITETSKAQEGRDRFMESVCIIDDKLVTLLSIDSILDQI